LASATGGFRAYTTETARRIDVQVHPRLGPSLPLQTAGGGLISFGALRGRWLLVEFIHTRCTTYCSAQGGQFARLQRELALPIASDELALLSVSFDPAHDDAAALVSYQRLHGDHGAGWIATRPVDAADLTTLLRVSGRHRARRAGRVRARRRDRRGGPRQQAGRHPDWMTRWRGPFCQPAVEAVKPQIRRFTRGCGAVRCALSARPDRPWSCGLRPLRLRHQRAAAGVADRRCGCCPWRSMPRWMIPGSRWRVPEPALADRRTGCTQLAPSEFRGARRGSA
jgi:cytochrome oxidase Cu insertion factor (SCO1/SenC/PrrC family)